MAELSDKKDTPASWEDLQAENYRLRQQLTRFEAAMEDIKKIKGVHLKALNIIGYSTDRNFAPVYYIGAINTITGYEENDFLEGQLKWMDLLHPEDITVYREALFRLVEQGEAQIVEYRIISGEGQIRWLNDMVAPIKDQSGQVVATEGLIMDLTSRKKIEEDLLERQAQLDSILTSVQDVIWSVTPDTFDLIYISPSAEKIFGYPIEDIYRDAANGYQLLRIDQEILMENFSTLLQRGWFEVEYCRTLPSGEKRWLQRRAHFAHDVHGFVSRIDGTDVDITLRKQAEDSLRYISMHDFLTGLYNRFYFEKEMYAIDGASMDSVGLIVCDIDGLKLINDHLGHEAGDKLLKQCSEVLTHCFNQDEIVSRIGGDEFTILIKNCTPETLEIAVAQLRQAVIEHNQAGGLYPLSVSIGYALKTTPDLSMREVFRQADNLMYAEKPEKHRSFHKLYRTLKL